MPALIEEVTVLNVTCDTPGCKRGFAEGITSRPEAESLAVEHDETWHTPILEDVVTA